MATTVTSHQALIDLQQVTNLSIRGRDPISLLKVLPGVGLLANDQEDVWRRVRHPVLASREAAARRSTSTASTAATVAAAETSAARRTSMRSPK